MSKLRISFLRGIRIIGNHSGCHQLPERSFFYKGKQFPVCARCTGVFLGQCFAIIIALFKPIPFSIATISLGIMGSDWLIQELGIKTSTNGRRLLTGICGGFGVFAIYILILKYVTRNLFR